MHWQYTMRYFSVTEGLRDEQGDSRSRIITNLIQGDQSLPAISVVEGTDDDSGQVVFTGCGRLQQAARTVVLVTHLLSVV